MISGDSFSRVSVTLPWKGRHSQERDPKAPMRVPTRVYILVCTAWRLHWEFLSVFGLDPVCLLAFLGAYGSRPTKMLGAQNPEHAVFDIQGAKLTPTIEEYWTLIGRTAVSHGIVEPNIYTTQPTLVSHLLGVQTTRLNAEVAYSGSTEIAIEKILSFIQSWMHKVQRDVLRKDLCHAFLLLIFESLLFLPLRALVDVALAGVVLQVVGGREYEGVISTGALLTPSTAVQAELTSLGAERDRLYQEVTEKDEQLIDQCRLQRELAQARVEIQKRDQELARVNVALERSRKMTHGGPHPS
ncbi:hypothetical protein CRG98_021337 [Punica granatum]|uniref:Uncharacterized protein n=1 Tax=Punica granatum TaxID=22663 RepID=A0A2I0JPN3_PUNGR|nr:hypothetical protein CRG98_021337 [Punica granatum]